MLRAVFFQRKAQGRSWPQDECLKCRSREARTRTGFIFVENLRGRPAAVGSSRSALSEAATTGAPQSQRMRNRLGFALSAWGGHVDGSARSCTSITEDPANGEAPPPRARSAVTPPHAGRPAATTVCNPRRDGLSCRTGGRWGRDFPPHANLRNNGFPGPDWPSADCRIWSLALSTWMSAPPARSTLALVAGRKRSRFTYPELQDHVSSNNLPARTPNAAIQRIPRSLPVLVDLVPSVTRWIAGDIGEVVALIEGRPGRSRLKPSSEGRARRGARVLPDVMVPSPGTPTTIDDLEILLVPKAREVIELPGLAGRRRSAGDLSWPTVRRNDVLRTPGTGRETNGVGPGRKPRRLPEPGAGAACDLGELASWSHRAAGPRSAVFRGQAYAGSPELLTRSR